MRTESTVFLLLCVTLLPSQNLWAQEKEPEEDPRTRTRWAFPVGTSATWKRTVTADGEVTGISQRKEFVGPKGLMRTIIGGDNDGTTLAVSRSRPTAPRNNLGFGENEMKIDGETVKCAVLLREETVAGRSKLQKLLAEAGGAKPDPEKDKPRRRRFELWLNPKWMETPSPVPFRELPLAGPNLAMPGILVAAKVEVFPGESKTAETTIDVMVDSLEAKHSIGDTRLFCVSERCTITTIKDGRQATHHQHRLLSGKVLGHVVFDRRTTTRDGKKIVIIDEVIAFETPDAKPKSE